MMLKNHNEVFITHDFSVIDHLSVPICFSHIGCCACCAVNVGFKVFHVSAEALKAATIAAKQKALTQESLSAAGSAGAHLSSGGKKLLTLAQAASLIGGGGAPGTASGLPPAGPGRMPTASFRPPSMASLVPSLRQASIISQPSSGYGSTKPPLLMQTSSIGAFSKFGGAQASGSQTTTVNLTELAHLDVSSLPYYDRYLVLELWDIPGAGLVTASPTNPVSRDPVAILQTYGQDLAAAVIVTDASDPLSFRHIQTWRDAVRKVAGKHKVPIYLLANKVCPTVFSMIAMPLLSDDQALTVRHSSLQCDQSTLTDDDVRDTAKFFFLNAAYLVSCLKDQQILVAFNSLLSDVVENEQRRQLFALCEHTGEPTAQEHVIGTTPR